MSKLLTWLLAPAIPIAAIIAVIVGLYITSPAEAAEYEEVKTGDTVFIGWVCWERLGGELVLAGLQFAEANEDPRLIAEIQKHCAPIRTHAVVTGVYESTIDFEGDKVTLVAVAGPEGRTFWSVAYPKFTIVDRPKSA